MFLFLAFLSMSSSRLIPNDVSFKAQLLRPFYGLRPYRNSASWNELTNLANEIIVNILIRIPAILVIQGHFGF